MQCRLRGSWRHWVGIALGAVLLCVFLTGFLDWNAAAAHMAAVNWYLIGFAVSGLLIGTYLRVAKWVYIVNLKDRLAWQDGNHVMMVSLLINYFLPIRAGEAVKIYLARKVASVSYTSSIAATIVDRLSALVLIFACFTFYPFSGFKLLERDGSAELICFLVGALAVGVIFFGDKIVNAINSKAQLSRIGGSKKHCAALGLINSVPVQFILHVLSECSILSMGRRHLCFVFILSGLILLLDSFSNYWLLAAFRIHITPLQALLAACMFNLAFALPSPPAQVGVAEIVPLAIFTYGLGLPAEIITASGVLWHLLAMAVVAILGIYSSLRLGINPLLAVDKSKCNEQLIK